LVQTNLLNKIHGGLRSFCLCTDAGIQWTANQIVER